MERKNILVIDDEDFIVTLISRALKREGYSVMVAADYNSALRLLQNSSTDLVISDVILREGDGIDLLNYIKSESRLAHIPVILISGLDQSSMCASVKKAEAVLCKPFDMAQLLGIVRSRLNPYVSEAN